MNWLESIAVRLRQLALQMNLNGDVDCMQTFTPRAQKVLELARDAAAKAGCPFLRTEHLILGILELGQGGAFDVMTAGKIDIESTRQELEKGLPPKQPPTGAVPMPTPGFLRVIMAADMERKDLKHEFTGTEHLLLGVLREPVSLVREVFARAGFTLESVRKEVQRIRSAPDESHQQSGN